jgi:hypothetical protein
MSEVRHRSVVAALALLLAACGGELAPIENAVLDTPVENLRALPDGRIMYEADELLWVLDSRIADAAPAPVAPLSTVGAIQGAAVNPGGGVLVAAEGGLFLLRGTTWAASAIGEALESPVTDVLGLEGEIWFATEADVQRFRDGVLERLDLAEDLAGARLNPAPGGDGLWVRTAAGTIFEVRVEGRRVETSRVLLDTPVARAWGDGLGGVWLLDPSESLYRLSPGRTLSAFGRAPLVVAASPASTEAWFVGAGGGARIFSVDGLQGVAGADLPDATSGAVDGDGALVVGDASGVRRFSPRRRVRVRGPGDDSILVAPVDFPVETEDPEAATVTADADGLELEVTTEPTLAVLLDPRELGDGGHVLTIRVRFGDGTLPTVVTRRFRSISGATWEGDVLPIFDADCAACHTRAGPAITNLEAPEMWGPQRDQILVNVRDGRMPLGAPPLEPLEIAAIESWLLSAFPDAPPSEEDGDPSEE